MRKQVSPNCLRCSRAEHRMHMLLYCGAANTGSKLSGGRCILPSLYLHPTFTCTQPPLHPPPTQSLSALTHPCILPPPSPTQPHLEDDELVDAVDELGAEVHAHLHNGQQRWVFGQQGGRAGGGDASAAA